MQEEARKLQGDFVPNGGLIVIHNTLRFRFTKPDEIYRCCARSSYDTQSGLIFCGRIARYVADVDEHRVVALCGIGSHVPRHLVWKPHNPRAEDPNRCRCGATEENRCCSCNA